MRAMPARTVGLLVIGDEILSGRTAEKNLQTLARLLGARGLRLAEARVVGDDIAVIAAALNDMRAAFDFVVTSGGIGPTHDDITTDAVSFAFGLQAEENAAILARLKANCETRGLPLTDARRRMSRAPVGAEMMASEFEGPPGYRIANVFVCAGVPDIFTMMAEAAAKRMPQGAAFVTLSFRVVSPESAYAEMLTEVQRAHPKVKIGSYPRAFNDCAIVFTGDDKQTTTAAQDEARQKFQAAGIEVKEEQTS